VDKDQVAVVDTKTLTVIGKWPTAPGGGPTGMSMDVVHHRLFIGCRRPQKLIVMSSDNGKVLADLPIGAGNDGTQFAGDAFASCRTAPWPSLVKRRQARSRWSRRRDTTRPGRWASIRRRTRSPPTAEFGKQKDAKGRLIPKPAVS